VSLDACLEAADRLEAARLPFASLTGGEPLLQPEAVARVAAELRARGPRVLLETHGLAAQGLARVVESIDVVSMDWKLASDVRRASDPRHGAVDPFHEAHGRFLRVARRAPEVVVKVVVTPRSADAEIDALCETVHREAPGALVVVQPVSPSGPVREAPGPARLLELVDRIARVVPRVRLIPQTHKQVGVL
jgi:pyruvate-formate lyase-activating enzyme